MQTFNNGSYIILRELSETFKCCMNYKTIIILLVYIVLNRVIYMTTNVLSYQLD